MLSSWMSGALLFATICGRVANARTVTFVPPPAEVLDAEGIVLDPQAKLLAAPIAASPLDRTGWTATTDSAQGGLVGTNALDGNANSMWHTQWDPTNVALPHTITIDMKSTQFVDGVTYLPRQDGNSNGNIGQHQLFLSTDGTNFNLVAFGTWLDDNSEKTADFETTPARYIRLVALSEAGNRGPWTSAAEINVYGAGLGPGNTLDGDTASIWHTQWDPTNAALPHTITIDMKAALNVDGITYLPRQDGNANGNIGNYQILTSTNGVDFNQVTSGTWIDDPTLKGANFASVSAQYIRIVSQSEAGNRGPWTSASEINVSVGGPFVPPPNGKGQWGPTVNFPLVPVAASVQPNTGKVVAWSSWSAKTFGGDGGRTVTALYDPASQTVTQRVVTNTGHDMFCPSISIDANGRTLVTGGDSSQKASIYTPSSDSWSSAANLITSRGYHSSATCSDGRIFTIGGSWSGGEGNKNGEIYNPNTNGWTSLGGCPVAPMLTADQQGVFRSDNHAWLFGWKSGSVFQAGPSIAMNWYGTSGGGSRQSAGNRATDGHSMCGNAIMYDAVAGKILTVGGSPNYQNTAATSAAHIITIGNPGSTAQVTKIGDMNFPRIFHSSVVLPDGKVYIGGGQSVGSPFQDSNLQLTPELWDPATNQFTQLIPNSIPRVYHSFALLLQDATVMLGGGGLCDTCSANHFDAQIYTPQYLLNADGTKATRPVISSISTNNVVPGNTVTVNTNGAVSSMSLVRYGSATHTVNTDQRRIPLSLVSLGRNSYRITIPNDYGISLPGYWMLFAMDSAGHPSVSKTIQIRGP
ncbi:MAG: hypothetical protein M1840_004038 [Geoglossum simile]|nr:MAG: hypothetical protein M1840_004038 [Geoglossum simile]